MIDLPTALTTLDRVVHEPARLVLLTALGECEDADFLYLQRLTGLSKGNLSSHLARLETEGLITIDRRFVGKRPRTIVALTPVGRHRIERHWSFLESLRSQQLRRTRP